MPNTFTDIVIGVFGYDLACICAEVVKKGLAASSVLQFAVPATESHIWLVLAQVAKGNLKVADCVMKTGPALSSMDVTTMV